MTLDRLRDKYTKPCPECGGNGEILYHVQHGNVDEYHTESDVCPACNGTGRVDRNNELEREE